MEALQGVTEMVSSIDDAPARDKVKLQIAEKLIATDPKLLVELIQHKPEVRKEIPIEGVKIMEGEIGFSTAEIKAIVSNITTAYREIMCADSKGLPSLKAVLDRILLLTKDKIPSLELYNELVQQTNMLETPIEVQTEIKGETTIEKLDDLTKKDGLSLITDEAIEGIKKLFEQTGSDNELKLADKLLDKLTHNFGATISDIRLKTAQAFKKLYSGIETLKNPEIVKSVDNQLIATEDKESHGPTYSEIASILQEAANRYLKEGNRKKSSEIIQLFRKHTHSKEGFLDRYKLAEETMHKFAESELSRLLLDELCSTDESKQKDTGLLVELGDFVVSALIQRIKETPNIEVRKSIVFLIEKIGETAITRLVEELDLEKRAESSLRIIELLDKIGHPDIVVEQLRETLSNPDFNVRKAVVRKLNEIGTDRAKQIIVDVITNDPSPGIRQLGIGFLGDAKYTPAVSPLIDLISVQSRQIGISASLQHTALGKMGETIQEETCIALGKIGAKEAIPALRLAARSGTAFRRAKSDKVRVAAVQALVNLGDSEVSKFANDSNLLIQKIVREMQQG
ncbi:MAG: HEAT repeat domain-containing protein [Candidatus Stahlbacteria bacterium]|nr:HEAT repeat domain-containing protein [Candidatus Stahlbacteria bacterium]